MATSEFLFRDQYPIDEKIRRIPPGKITGTTGEIRSRINDLGLAHNEVNKLGKHDFFDEAEDSLSNGQFEALVSSLFDEYGAKGDKCNMQLFLSDGRLNYDDISQAASDSLNARLDTWIDALSEPIVLTDVRTQDDCIDLQFRTSVQREDIEPDENIPIQIIRREDGVVVQDYGSEFTVRAPARYRVEARVYPRSGYIAVSNYSRISDGLKADIAKTITELSGTDNTVSRLELNQTELLLLQQEMEGDVSGLGYTLEIAGVDTADISGTRDEDMFGTHIVKSIDESGQIRKIKFYVDYLGEDEPERAVMLRIFDNGHLTTSKPVQTELLDAIVDEIKTIRNYKGYLTPLSELIFSYAPAKFRGQPSTARASYIRKTHEAFNRLIERNFGGSDTPTSEERLYRSMVANIGIKLCETGIPTAEDTTDVYTTDEFYDYEGKIEEFFNDITRRQLDLRSINYDELSNHLNHLLEQDWDSPVDIIEYAIEKYDLN